jgi:ABC-type cobalamin/Fe3+-siderophores transport system ATPase subunit
MERASKWWKCDLQIATPPSIFNAGGGTYNWNDEADCRRFAAIYAQALVDRCVHMVAMANHKRSDAWIDYMRDAGRSIGLVVLPGVEITTGTGADGIHLVLIAHEDHDVNELDRLVTSACGFGHDHPPFNQDETPASSPRTAAQILDALPESIIAIAPHALNDNGIASQRTVQGDIRWKVLHHPRLSAIDVGDPTASGDSSPSWNERFRSRQLDHFPCLRWLPFIATSDAYNLEDAGRRFTWIRMHEPTLEGLRQALLDREARTIPSWDPRLDSTPDPNAVDHAWISSISFSGLGNSTTDLEVSLDPHLNVVVGGRGSGKSTVVNGLLQLYGDHSALPANTGAEASTFANDVLRTATIRSRHWLRGTPLEQTASWTFDGGSLTERTPGSRTPTEFAATVVCQKELFERSGPSKRDENTASRYLLRLVDGWAGVGSATRFDTTLAEKRDELANATFERQRAQRVSSELDVVRARIKELMAQIATLDDPSAAERRGANDRTVSIGDALDSTTSGLSTEIERLRIDITQHLVAGWTPAEEVEGLQKLAESISAFATELRKDLVSRLDESLVQLAALEASPVAVAVRAAREDARADAAAYVTELAAAGIDPAAYKRLTVELEEAIKQEGELEERVAEAERWQGVETELGLELQELLDRRRHARREVFDGASESGLLRFELREAADPAGWSQTLRNRMSLRSDGFLTEVRDLADWVVSDNANLERWREALRSNSFGGIGRSTGLRTAFWNRLEELDERTRLRLATEDPDDLAVMFFRREDSAGDAWQSVDSGSPGERTAAMLSLVLAHGTDPLVLDQPEDDLDTEWISKLVVNELRRVRWNRQVIVVTHNANIPVNGDADRIIVMENLRGGIGVRVEGPVEVAEVRHSVQNILEGGVEAFVAREKRYNNELNTFRVARGMLADRGASGSDTVPTPAGGPTPNP